IVVDAHDTVSPAEKLAVDWRFGGGAWMQAVGAPARIGFAKQALDDVEIAVVDEAGNRTLLAAGDVIGFHGRVPSTGKGCGCTVGGRSSNDVGGGAVALAILAVGVLVVRRRRRVLALLAIVALGACGSDNTGTQMCMDCVQAGPTGRWLDIAAVDGRAVVS